MNESTLKRKAWAIMLIVFFAGIALAWAQNKVVPVIDVIQSGFSVSMAQAGWISSVFCVMGIILAFPAAGLMRKLGIKWCGVAAIGATIAGTALGVFADSYALIMASRVIEGFGVGLIAVLAPAIITMWFAPEKRGLPMGVWGAWQMVAQSGTFLLVGGLTGLFNGWQGMWWAGLVLLGASILLYVWQVKAPPATYNHADLEDSSVSMFKVLKYPAVWMITAVAFVFCVACFGWVTWIATYWSEQGGIDFELANSIVGWLYMAEILIVVGEGFLLDKVKSRKRFGIVFSVLYGVLLLSAFIVPPSFAWIVVFACIYPFLEGAICTVFWTICPQTTPDPRLGAAALATMVIGMNIGMMVGPPLVGGIIEAVGWAPASIVIGIAGGLCAVFFALTQLYNAKGEKIKG
ncbi:MAG: MFS transporter [Eggerthellaceae bacterium]|nr:MFS transporter [Eggerthellaceae bacterium]